MSGNNSIWNNEEMKGLEPIEKARRAIVTTLRRIREVPVVGYHINIGTKTFGQLTEAAAPLTSEPLEKLRRHFAHPASADPVAALKLITEAIEENKSPSGLLDADSVLRIQSIAQKAIDLAYF